MTDSRKKKQKTSLTLVLLQSAGQVGVINLYGDMPVIRNLNAKSFNEGFLKETLLFDSEPNNETREPGKFSKTNPRRLQS